MIEKETINFRGTERREGASHKTRDTETYRGESGGNMARKTEKGGKFRNVHCRTWNMARKLKIMGF